MFRAVVIVMNELSPLDEVMQTQEVDRLRALSRTAMLTNARVFLENTAHMDDSETVETVEQRVMRMENVLEYAESAEVIALALALNRPITVFAHIDSYHEVDYNHVYAPAELQQRLRFDPVGAVGDRIIIFHDTRQNHFSALRRAPLLPVRARESCTHRGHPWMHTLCVATDVLTDADCRSCPHWQHRQHTLFVLTRCLS